MAIRYSKKVLDHFSNPRNVGEIEDADGIGEVGNPTCGDIMTFYIKVEDDRLKDVKFKTFGCGAAIAVSSMISEMSQDVTLEEALKITNKDVAEELEGLPDSKMHCSNLAADALHAAIRSYEKRAASGSAVPEKVVIDDDHEEHEEQEDHEEGGEDTCRCPVCNVENTESKPFCRGCGRRMSGKPEE